MNTEKIMQHLIGKTYAEVVSGLSTVEDNGDCCGWAQVDVEDSLQLIEDKEKAILFDVVKIEYDIDEGERVVVNFIFDLGSQKGLILGYELGAGSGSGWSYGAYCELKYSDEQVAAACW